MAMEVVALQDIQIGQEIAHSCEIQTEFYE